jgi:HAD superfamily hydrolase (TIGR01509 family)
VVISCELGARKPTPESYARVLARYDATPENTFFADDNAGNIRGAIAAGIHGHHFTDPTLLDEAITAFAGRNS